tara:strand:+ start:6317 stop:6739 length:423 start_codon:yes stop_codon:yes gene_type:complete
MSIRDRLQGLVDLLETKEKPEEELVDEIEKIEELLTAEKEAAEEAEEPEEIEEAEVTWEELETVLQHQATMSRVQMLLGQVHLDYEVRKAKLVSAHVNAQKAVQEEIERLRAAKGIPEEGEYTFSFPEKPGESGLFKKDE